MIELSTVLLILILILLLLFNKMEDSGGNETFDLEGVCITDIVVIIWLCDNSIIYETFVIYNKW